MFSKINNKKLAIVFAILLVLLAISYITGSAHKHGSFNSKITDVDTSQVSSIIIYPPAKAEQIQLNMKDNNWTVSNSKEKYNADNNSVKEMLRLIHDLKATRIATKDKDRWKDYKVTDSLATRVQMLANNKIVTDVYIGRFSYQPPANNNPYMREQGTMTTYVRLAGENTVYATDGFLGMAFNRKISDFRDKKIAGISKDKVRKLSFSTPEGNYSLTKDNGPWMLDGLLTDSAKVEKFLSGLTHLSGYQFVKPEERTSDAAKMTLMIEGAPDPTLQIDAYPADTTNVWAIESSINKGAFFSGKKSGLTEKLFPGKDYFMKGDK